MTLTIAVIETKVEDDVIGKASALVIDVDNGGKVLNISTSILNSALITDSGATNHMTFDSKLIL